MIPKGYIEGLGREYPHPAKSHLYQGTFGDIKGPMCKWGANREYGYALSIWRGNSGKKGCCKICLKRALAKKNHIWTIDYFKKLDEKLSKEPSPFPN